MSGLGDFSVLMHGVPQEVVDLLNDEAFEPDADDFCAAFINAFRRINALEEKLKGSEQAKDNQFITAWLDEDTYIAGLSAHQNKRVRGLCQKFFNKGKESKCQQ